ncbi:uncharacterized protein TOT_020001058 [Theileria orientalis strain Shintoku]|uniref:FUZ/MON1/HPS1 first Longin domain-containing protein n=1 Tax=Theileria orientalis strain Shintoku TaxID=869250 RepID=J4C852_THEOR|nr:uncharacterized protein TOT_020001058 [Theileria orientalis strain Shintoku]BAM40183.1 uncharacterized protein TOT_020001058 [Theileria orientalis strain Shintoku]|eukprot:XP_009690484.1 uncharacterized protein TOT_020001058 [Theileria orientalis strain Shintoku]
MVFEVYGLTFAGKPLFSSRKDSEVSLAFYGTISAVASKVASLLSDYAEQDCLRYITVGSLQFTYLERGPLCYFAISDNGYSPLMVYKILCVIHLQVVSILTRGVERILIKRPSYDVQNLLGGTQSIIDKLMDNMSGCLGLIDDYAYEALPLSQTTRTLLTSYFTKFRTDNILYELFRRLGLQYAYHHSTTSKLNWLFIFKNAYAFMAFTYGYINYVSPEIGIVCISSSGDQEQFYNISGHIEESKRMMVESKCLDDLRSSLLATPLEFPSGGVPSCEILHLMFYDRNLGQFFSSAFKSSTCGNLNRNILSSYRSAVEFLHNSGYRRSALFSFEYLNVYVEYNNDYNIYLATAPWTDITTDLINKIYSYVTRHYNFLFITKIPSIAKRK